MYVLGNPILGKTFRRFGLVLNEKGLHKLVRVDDQKTGRIEHKFFLTDDIDKILDLMDLSLKDIETTIDVDAYIHLLACPYFHLGLFMGDEPEKSKELESFRQYLVNQAKINEVLADDVEPIRTARVEEILGIELREKIDHIRFCLSKFPRVYKPKFEAMKVLLLKNGYVPQNFSRDLPKFNKSFGGKFEFMEFFINNTPEELHEHYKKVTE